MTLQEMKLLHAYNAWASNRIFDALEKIPPEDIAKDLKSSHGSIQGTLTHMVAAEKIWLSRLLGTPDTTLMTGAEAPTLADLKAVWEKTGYTMAKLLGSLTDRKLQDTFTMVTTSGKSFTNTFGQAMQHVVDHSTYHRGQIVTLMRQLGHMPPSAGLIGFYRETAGVT